MGIASQVAAQTPAEVEKIVRKSKGLESTRPVKVIVQKNRISVSTYSHAQATDQDCQINALLIMKDLVARYKSLQQMAISFYDPVDHTRYRTVIVTKQQVDLVDRGRPVQEVLSGVSLTYGKSAAPAASASATTGRSAYSSSSGRASSVGEGGIVDKILTGLSTGKLPDSLGPYELERQLLTSTLWRMKSQGMNVQREEQMVNELNILAAKGDRASLDVKIPRAFAIMKIRDTEVEAWKRHKGWKGGGLRY